MAKNNTILGISTKHIQVEKANRVILIAASVCAALVVFSLVAINSLATQIKYQNKVIGLRRVANDQLQKNIKARDKLVTAYETFDNSPESIIGTADKNSKIVLDALPSKYDFPAVAISLENLIKSSGMTVTTISGTDNEASAEQENASPKPIDIPFSISAKGSKESTLNLLNNMQKSIRPISISNITLTAGSGDLNVNVIAKTYYQPARKLEVKPIVVPNGKKAVVVTPTKTGTTK